MHMNMYTTLTGVRQALTFIWVFSAMHARLIIENEKNPNIPAYVMTNWVTSKNKLEALLSYSKE